MKNATWILVRLVCCMGAILWAPACGDPTSLNQMPITVGSIPAQEVFIDDTMEIIVSAYFSDPDGDTLSYSARPSDASVVLATSLADTVRVIGRGQGTARVVVTATDPGGLAAEQSFEATTPNRAPEIAGTIAGQSVHVDDSATINVAEHFTDPDGDLLAYSAVSSDTLLVTAGVSGSMVTVTGMGVGSVMVTVTATDPGGLAVDQDFGVTVPNRAPRVVDAVGDREVEVDSTLSVDMADYFADPDRDPLAYSATSSTASRATVEMLGSVLSVTGAASGSTTVTVTVEDPGGLTAEQMFDVMVPNRPPVVSDRIGNREVYVGDTVVVDLARHFEDPDGDVLKYAGSSSDTYHASVSVSGSMVVISGMAVGSTTVAVTASDTAGLTAEQVFEVEVPNRAPRAVGTIEDREVHVSDTVMVDVGDYFTDPDGEALGYTVGLSDSTVVTATVSDDTVRMLAVAKGGTTVTITASDPGGLTAEQSFSIVTPNRTPEVADTIPPVERFIGETASVVVSAYFTDPDGDALSYSAESSDTDLATVAVSSDTVRVTAVSQGEATITVTASDPDGLSAEEDFSITIPNRAPETVGSIPAMEIEAPNQATAIVSGYFTDPDNDSLRHEAESSNTGIATVSVLADTVRVSGVVEGNATITVTATDPSGLSATQDFSVEIIPDRQREILKTIYDEMNGPNWRVSTNWLTDAPLDEWYGIRTNDQGQVIRIDLRRNFMHDVEIPPEIGGLTSLEYLMLELNGIVGPIPPEIGNLTNLTHLYLTDNDITGPLPPELGNLTKLNVFLIRRNDLDGSLPPELGNLTELTSFHLDHNDLTGPIPPEMGNLTKLYGLLLNDNELSGPIPPELGNLRRVDWFWLQRNQLTGAIPKELGRLAGASEFNLSNNKLTGPIPAELGGLTRVNDFFLHGNDLSGSLPAGLSGLESLENLTITNNSKMSGPIADEFTEVEGLVSFLTGGTGVCAPDTDDFHDWLRAIPKRRVHICDRETIQAYLVQQVQEREYPVPLVPNRETLLRVFVTATKSNNEDIPKVVATFYVDDEKSHEVTIASKAGPIPTKVDEGSLAKSSNAEIAGSEIEPGLEMVIEIDPDNTLEDGLLTTKRMPSSGRFKFEVDDLPSFDLTLVPFLWEEDPDSGIIDIFKEMKDEEEDHELLQETYDMLPIEGVNVSMHDPVVSSENGTHEILKQVRAIRTAEDGSGYWLGSMTGERTGYAGMAYVGAWVSAVRVHSAGVIGHELGHNMNNRHAPCHSTPNPDPSFPDPDGTIGAWGYDHRNDELVDPDTPDFMSYCSPSWVSSYYYSNMVRYRVFLDSNLRMAGPGILVWGGVDGDGNPSLEPAFVIDAPPSPPDRTGPFRLTGKDSSGSNLFSFPFAMDTIADGEVGAAGFAFILPVEPEWAGSLESITLTAPGGSVSLDGETDTPMAIVRDVRSGQIRAFLRGLSEPPALPTGFEVYWSRGIPDREAWKR